MLIFDAGSQSPRTRRRESAKSLKASILLPRTDDACETPGVSASRSEVKNTRRRGRGTADARVKARRNGAAASASIKAGAVGPHAVGRPRTAAFRWRLSPDRPSRPLSRSSAPTAIPFFHPHISLSLSPYNPLQSQPVSNARVVREGVSEGSGEHRRGGDREWSRGKLGREKRGATPRVLKTGRTGVA